MKEIIDELSEKLSLLEDRLSLDFDENIENEVYELEEQIEFHIKCEVNDYFYFKLQKLSKRLKQIKVEYDFFDEENELDRMFPDRHDEDFDEDSIYDIVFRDD